MGVSNNMADIKWIKIATDIFDNRKIKMLETLPDGDSIIVIWFKLLSLAGNINDNGSIYFTKDLAFTPQMLATAFNRPQPTVELALNTFKQFGMITIVDDLIKVSNWEKYQNVEGMDKVREQARLRQQNRRQRLRIEAKNEPENHVIVTQNDVTDNVTSRDNSVTDNVTSHDGNVTGNVTPCDSNVTSRDSHALDIDIDIDKDINIFREKQKRKKAPAFRPPTVDEVRNYCIERQNSVDPEHFVDFYAAKGWYVGKNKMQDWQAAVRTWERDDKNKPKVQPRNFLPQMMENEYDFEELEKKLLDN